MTTRTIDPATIRQPFSAKDLTNQLGADYDHVLAQIRLGRKEGRLRNLNRGHRPPASYVFLTATDPDYLVPALELQSHAAAARPPGTRRPTASGPSSPATSTAALADGRHLHQRQGEARGRAPRALRPSPRGTPGPLRRQGCPPSPEPHATRGASPMNAELHQRCSRCGTEEAAGAYCTWCRGADYDLILHAHAWQPGVPTCPLGPYLNPANRPSANQARAFLKTRQAWRKASPLATAKLRVLHHRSTGASSAPPPAYGRFSPGEAAA